MPGATYTLAVDPNGPVLAPDIFDSNSDVTSSLGGSQHNTFDGAAVLGTTGRLTVGVDSKSNVSWSLAVFDTLDNPIPADAVITKCVLHGTADGNGFGPFNGDFSFAAKDGRWNNGNAEGTGASTWRIQRWYDYFAIVRRDDGATVMVSASGTSNFATPNIVEVFAPRYPVRSGESFGVTSATSGTLSEVIFELSRVGGLAGPGSEVQADIYNATANDGSNDAPLGTAIASSDTIPFNDLTAFPGFSEVTFSFTGADRIFLEEDKRYVTSFQAPALSEPNKYPAVFGTAITTDERGPETDKAAVLFGGAAFLDATNYGIGRTFPTPTFNDNVTPKDEQAGAILRIPWPAIAINTVFEVEGLEGALQGFVNRTDYVPGDRLCLVMGPGDASTGQQRPLKGRGIGAPFSPTEELTLQVDWRPRRVQVV
jgi:hypothetical protein